MKDSIADTGLQVLQERAMLYRLGVLPQLPWLDQTSFAKIDAKIDEKLKLVEGMHVFLDLEEFDVPVVFCDHGAAASQQKCKNFKK